MAPVELGAPGSRIKVTVSPGENFSMLLNFQKNRDTGRESKIKVQVECSNDDQQSKVTTSLVEGRPKIKLGPISLGFKEESTDGTVQSVVMKKGDRPVRLGLEIEDSDFTEDFIEFRHR